MLAYNEKPVASWTPIKTLCAANLGLATAALFFWPFIAEYVADPVGTAAESSMDASSRPELWNYPFLLIWAFPLLGAWMAYVMHKAKLYEAARFFGALPLALIGSCIAWYWLFQMTDYGTSFYHSMSAVLTLDPRTIAVWMIALSGLILAFVSSIAGMRDMSKYFLAIPVLGLPAYYFWVYGVERADAWLPTVLGVGW